MAVASAIIIIIIKGIYIAQVRKGHKCAKRATNVLGHMQVCSLLQTDNHASTPTTQFFTGRMPFLPPNQQRQSTEGTIMQTKLKYCIFDANV